MNLTNESIALIWISQDKSAARQRRPLFLRRNIRNKATLASRAEGVATIGPNGMVVLDALRSTAGKDGESRTEEQQQQHKQIVGGVAKDDNKATTVAARSDYQIVDNTEVKLNVNSYKMIWVTNKNGLFYKRNSISKARKVRPLAATIYYWTMANLFLSPVPRTIRS